MAGLVLSRKIDEKIRVGEILITLLSARGGKARIMIEAPRGIKILRCELEEDDDPVQVQPEPNPA